MGISYIKWFTDLNRNSLPTAGGKGANLGEMAAARLPVPEGFVVITSAYREFVAANGLQKRIELLANRANPNDVEQLDRISEEIRSLFELGSIPSPIIGDVIKAYQQLGSGTVAVRSSATAEDLPSASFAGQQETYLDIEGAEAVVIAVRRCWSSLWTARALSYRIQQRIQPHDVSLAVVIQRLVPAKAAGVLFTANPLNGRRDQMVIDGSWGLGEAVVSGLVTPDHWVVKSPSAEIIEQQISKKTVWTIGQPGGAKQSDVPADLQDQPCLDSAQIKGLVELGSRVAEHYGSPQDIEWAFSEDGKLYLLQARPITSLFPVLYPPVPTDKGLRLYVCFNTLQGLAEPMTPAGISAFQMAGCAAGQFFSMGVEPGQIPPAMKSAAGRLYLDGTNALTHERTKKLLLFMSSLIDRQTSEMLRDLCQSDPDLSAKPGFPFKLNKPLLFRMLSGFIQVLMNPEGTRNRILAEVDALITGWERDAQQLTGIEPRLQYIEKLLNMLLPQFVARLVPVVAGGMIARFNAEGKLEQWLGDATAFQAVLRSLPHNPTTEMDLALWRLSRTLKASGDRPKADHPLIKDFLAKYGHRAVREIDIGMPRWWDDPSHIINVLNNYLEHDETSDAEKHFRQGEQEAKQAVTRLVQQVRNKKGRMAAATMAKLLRRTRALMGVREYPKFYAVRLLALVRRILGDIGDELVRTGRLNCRDDVYFISLYDLRTDGDLVHLAAAHRNAYARDMERRLIPRVITSEGETFYTLKSAKEGALVGTPASVGVYEGKVRVVLDPKGAALEQGEILVAPGTDPAWTPLFLSAGALVMEIGGMMSHGSVVAREYGIPAVVGVIGATSALKTGQRIRVDGAAGTIEILE